MVYSVPGATLRPEIQSLAQSSWSLHVKETEGGDLEQSLFYYYLCY